MAILAYLAIGLLAGLLSGLLGIGGGIIIVPALDFMFKQFNLSADYTFHMAAATSLASIVVITSTTAISYIRLGHILWSVVRYWLPSLLIAVILASLLANQLPAHFLRMVFAVFMLFQSLRIFSGFLPFSLPFKWGAGKANQSSGKRLRLFLSGVFVGGASGMLGIGLGSLGVPLLMNQNISIRKATGTVATCAPVVTLFGAMSFAISGWHVLPLSWTTGYIYWPAFLSISSASLIASPLGAYLAHRLPTSFLRAIFAVFLLIVSLLLII